MEYVAKSNISSQGPHLSSSSLPKQAIDRQEKWRGQSSGQGQSCSWAKASAPRQLLGLIAYTFTCSCITVADTCVDLRVKAILVSSYFCTCFRWPGGYICFTLINHRLKYIFCPIFGAMHAKMDPDLPRRPSPLSWQRIRPNSEPCPSPDPS